MCDALRSDHQYLKLISVIFYSDMYTEMYLQWNRVKFGYFIKKVLAYSKHLYVNHHYNRQA